MRRVVIIGGGIAGLATALQIRDRAERASLDLEVQVLEAASRLGGNIRTESSEGFTLEWGPNGYLDNVPAMGRLVERVGLAAEVQQAAETATKRYLFRNGRLHQLPSGPVSFLTCPVLSIPGRLRVFLEPFAKARPEDVDETIHDFASRRIGSEAAEVLIDAMVSGIFAGDTRALSLASAFPKMAGMEAAHGSLVRAMIARMREKKAAERRVSELQDRGESSEELTRPGGPAGPGGTLTSFRRGLETLVQGVASSLGPAVRTGVPPRAIEYEPGTSGRAWAVVEESGRIEADAIVVATPSHRAEPLLTGIDPRLGEAVRGISTSGLAVVALGFEEQALGGAPDGFGFLVPRSERIRSLGCLWDSSIFPGRAPSGAVLLRVMVGGAHDPEAVRLDDDELVSLVRRDLQTTMGLSAEPVLQRIFRHPAGIAQYEQGHQERVNGIDRLLEEYPGLWVAGSSYHGISMNSCVEVAEHQAEAIVSFLESGRNEHETASRTP